MVVEVQWPEVTLVVPVHRDSPETRRFLSDLSRVWPDYWSVVVVDNGSGADFTPSLKPGFRLLVLPVNVGYGGAVRSALASIQSRSVVWCPGNGKVSAEGLVSFTGRAVSAGALLVKAKRRGRLRRYAWKSFLAGLIHSFLLKINMFDSGGTPSLTQVNFLRQVCLGDDGPEFDAWIFFIAQRMGVTYTRVPVRYTDAGVGESSWRRGFHSEIALLAKILQFRNRRGGPV